MSVENLIKTVLEEFRQIVRTETVVGEPVVVGETVIVPVSKISFGFGAGGGKGGKEGKQEAGTGTGGGASVEPVAFIVIRNGKAQLLPLEDKGMTVSKLLEYAPDVVKKVKEFREKRERKKAQKESEEREGEAGEDA